MIIWIFLLKLKCIKGRVIYYQLGGPGTYWGGQSFFSWSIGGVKVFMGTSLGGSKFLFFIFMCNFLNQKSKIVPLRGEIYDIFWFFKYIYFFKRLYFFKDSFSELLIFQNFPGGRAPGPPPPCFNQSINLFTISYNITSHMCLCIEFWKLLKNLTQVSKMFFL